MVFGDFVPLDTLGHQDRFATDRNAGVFVGHLARPVGFVGASKLTEALRYTPGVNAEPFGSRAALHQRQYAWFHRCRRRHLSRWVGADQSGLGGGYNLEPYGAERIEVPRGPASVLYGQGSPGGLINFVTKMPKDQAFGELGLEYGNNDRKQAQFDVGSSFDEAGTWAAD